MKRFHKYIEWRVLEHYLRHPDREFHIRELARLLKISPKGALDALNGLNTEGILTGRAIGNVHLFRLNNDLPLVKALKTMDILSRLHEARLVDRLLDVDDAIISIVLYGSCSSGEYDEESDLDILLVTPTARARYDPLVRKVEHEVGMKVNLVVLSLTSWMRLEARTDPFRSEVKRNHVLLYGSDVP